MATYIVGAIVFGVIGFAGYSVFNSRKKGSGCGCGCADCLADEKCNQ